MRRARNVVALIGVAVLMTELPVAAQPPGGGPGDPMPDDTIAPVITVNRPAGSVDGWHNGPVTISMTVSDSHEGATGVARATYRLTGATTASGSFVNNRAELQISAEGSTRIDIEAEDRAENPSQATHWVGVDTAAPTVTFETPISARTFARGQKVPVRYQCADAGVGVDTCIGTVANGADLPTQQLGSFTLQVVGRDRLGNARQHNVSYTVAEPYFAVVQRPTVQGQAVVGEQVSMTDARFSPAPDSVTYQWRRNGQPIAGEQSLVYQLRPEDVGTALTVTATARKTGFQDETATSEAVTVRPGVLQMASGPRLSGDARVGGELTVSHTVVQPESATTSYQWFRGGRPITGATSRTYRPVAADLGATLRAEVSATAPGYTARQWASPESSAVQPVGPVGVSGTTSIAGTPRVGQVLTARPATFDGGAAVTYQWVRGTRVIPGATGRTYRLAVADRGSRVSVRVTGARPGHTSTVSTSGSTAVVAKARPKVTAKASARGKRRVRVAVTLRAEGTPVTGTVTVKRGSKVVARNRPVRSGRVTVDLGRQKKGRATYTVVYGGSAGVEPGSARARTIRVR